MRCSSNAIMLVLNYELGVMMLILSCADENTLAYVDVHVSMVYFRPVEIIIDDAVSTKTLVEL